MGKPEWGIKRTCQSCGTRFYDLNKRPIGCPSCEAEFVPVDFQKSRRGRGAGAAAAAAAAAATKKAAAEKDEAETLVKEAADDIPDSDDGDDGDKKLDDDEEKDVVIEDTSDLGEDEDDLTEVREHIVSDDDNKDAS